MAASEISQMSRDPGRIERRAVTFFGWSEGALHRAKHGDEAIWESLVLRNPRWSVCSLPSVPLLQNGAPRLL